MGLIHETLAEWMIIMCESSSINHCVNEWIYIRIDSWLRQICSSCVIWISDSNPREIHNLLMISPVFSVTWSFRNILICWFAAQKTYNIIINVETVLLPNIFEETLYFFPSDVLMNRKFRKQHLFVTICYNSI